MEQFNPDLLKQLYIPPSDSHKGQNGKMMLIGGSKLFHAASLWALNIASRIIDMVYYASVTENNQIVQKAKEEFRNGIVIPRGKIEDYASEAESIVIGPGLPRPSGTEAGEEDTQELTERLLKKFPEKKWIIDGGSLQVISPEILPKKAILTPHGQEFEKLFGLDPTVEHAGQMAKKYDVIIVLKGEKDYICSSEKCIELTGGNAGMTKGGTGDVLAGLIGALATKNDPFVAAVAGAYLNKKAGEALFKKVGYYYNSSDLANEIPVVMKETLLENI